MSKSTQGQKTNGQAVPQPAFVLTADIVKKAIKTGHDDCRLTGCLHADGLGDAHQEYQGRIATDIHDARDVVEAVQLVANDFFHIGFRAAQLLYTAPTAKENI